MKKKVIILLFVIALGIFAFFRFQEDTWLCVDGKWVKHGKPSAPMPETGCGETSEPITQTEPVVPPITDTQEEANIVVDSPVSDAQVSSPLKATGKARIYESTFAYRLTDSVGNVLAEGRGMTTAPDMGQFGPFEIDISFTTNSDKGTLEVFSHSPKDGAEINKVTVPLSFKTTTSDITTETSTVKVYFMNNKFDPQVTCEKVFPVERTMPKTQSIAKAAIEELLKGPTDNDRYLQYTTQLNDGVILNILTIIDGVAKADFSKKLEEGVGGSCRVGLIRRQIEETLKQFDSVKDVAISIEGRAEDILQP